MNTTKDNTTEYADAETIREWIATLAMSQGSYGRLLEQLDAEPELYDRLAENKFKDILDMVLFLECGA